MLLGGCLISGSCGESSRPVESGVTLARESPTTTDGNASGRLNLDEIFPAGRGRELVLNNCTSCHNITPIVTLQLTKDAWALNARGHRERVAALEDADFLALYEYLSANFNPDRPVPRLPRELLDQWTSY